MTARLPTLNIAPDKITDYLLNVHHVEGGSKARWFLARGFRVDHPEQLAMHLAGQAFANWPGSAVLAPPHGTKHRIVAPIVCPDGSRPLVLAIWMVEEDETTARFITARPYRAKGDASG